MSALPSDALQKPPLAQKSAGFLAFGTEFVNPNFADMAEAVGVRGIRIEDPADVEAGVAAALDLAKTNLWR
jgi:thiamine pyrophosphate-dependent acetolactate synthase large subunit-like protein